MKILVTGANGYIGRHVVKYALDRGHEVIAADFKFDGVDERASHYDGNIFSGSENIYEECGKPDVCIHLAWKDGFVHNSDAHMYYLSDHVKFLFNLIKGGLPMLSVMGTMHEVGYWEGAIDENTPCNPLSQYGIAKNALRQSVLQYALNTECKIHWLRAYYITGDDIKANSIFSKIAKAVLDGKKDFPLNSGKNKYDFIDVDMLAKMIVEASVQDQVNGIINVCTGNPISLGEKVEQYIKEHNYDIELKYGVFPDRQYDSPGVWGDNCNIKMILDNMEK